MARTSLSDRPRPRPRPAGWLEVNRALCRITGYPQDHLLTKTCQDITHPDDLESDLEAQRRMLAGEIRSYRREKRYIHADGHVVWVILSVSLVHDASGDPLHFVSQVEDVSERKHSRERLAHLARHDELTGLPNRATFEEHLELALARARRHDRALAVLYIDLDRFTLVNDSLGHAAGDRALCEVAARLRRVVRAEDLVARHSGDEFLVVLADLERTAGRVPSSGLSGATPPSVSAVARQIHQALREPFAIDGNWSSMRAWRGTTASRGGLSHVYASRSIYPGNELVLRGRLRKAVERGEFMLHYQPIVTLEPARKSQPSRSTSRPSVARAHRHAAHTRPNRRVGGATRTSDR